MLPSPNVSTLHAMTPLQNCVRDAAQYWERRRLAYNGVLATIVLLALAWKWPYSKSWFGPPVSSTLVEAAIIANILYCAAYFAEVGIRFTPFVDRWHRWRSAAFIVGLLMASGLALMIVGVIAIGPMSN